MLLRIPPVPTLLITIAAMIAFAANSLLCRLALSNGAIDAGNFTLLRLLSGALTLAIIAFLTRRPIGLRSDWRFSIQAGLALFGYAIFFSFAYLELSTGTGALLLFGSVQLTLLAVYRWQGNRFTAQELCGVIVSLLGFVWLMAPAASRPDPLAALLMIVSGLSWAAFTLLGKQAQSPQKAITQGFIVAAALSLLTLPWLLLSSSLSLQGIVLATTSGALASALGYILWYIAVARISLLQASVSQLAVPVIALLLGALWLGEAITLLNITTSALVLGGIALVFVARSKKV